MVRLFIFNVVDSLYYLWFAPIPYADLTVHLVCHHIFWVYWNVSYTIQQCTHPVLLTYSAWFTWKKVEFTIWKILNIVDWRSHKIYIYWFSHAQVVLDNYIGNWNDQRRNGMCTYRNRWWLMTFKWNGLVFDHVKQRNFRMSTSQYGIAIIYFHINDISILIRIKGIHTFIIIINLSKLLDRSIGISRKNGFVIGNDFIQNMIVFVDR